MISSLLTLVAVFVSENTPRYKTWLAML